MKKVTPEEAWDAWADTRVIAPAKHYRQQIALHGVVLLLFTVLLAWRIADGTIWEWWSLYHVTLSVWTIFWLSASIDRYRVARIRETVKPLPPWEDIFLFHWVHTRQVKAERRRVRRDEFLDQVKSGIGLKS